MQISPSMQKDLAGLHPTYAWVDLDRLTANYAALCRYSSVPLMPVVKTDAYGHGAATVARTLEDAGAQRLAVAYVEEAITLRRAGVRVPLVVLAGLGRGQARLLWEHALVPVIATPDALDAVLAAAPAAYAPLPVHVKVDTGMGRLGFPVAAVVDVARRLEDRGRITIEGLMTHLASADEDRDVTARQLDVFDAALDALDRASIRPRLVHAAASAGLAFLRPTHTLARPGLMLYGLQPRPLAPPLDVRPVMRVSARVALVKDVPTGAGVSYGLRWVARRPSRVATLPIGYADGVPRTKENLERGYFTFGAQRLPVAGTVCMDLLTLDATDVGVAAGDEITFFGDDPTAWDVADWAGTTAWQTLTAVGARVPRVYHRGGRVIAIESRFTP